MKRISWLLVFLTAVAGNIFSQKIVINGYVKDASSGESLPYATVYFPALSTGVIANQYGYFSSLVQPGKVEVGASFVGYKTETLTLRLNADTTLQFFLKPPSIDEVNVRANKVTTLGNELNRTSIPMARIKEMPPFLGEYDIIKALAMTPGVNSGTDGSSSLFVRGGSADQNLVLLDGATIYSNSHLFGFVSVFNPEAISHAELLWLGYRWR